MSSAPPPFALGTLLDALRARTGGALASGKLQPIDTEETIVEASGVPLMLRVAGNLARKESGRKQSNPGERPANPFLPYDEDLCVAGVSDTHVALLNKFNVLENHLLVVTRAFERQDHLLTRADFAAQCRCMIEFDSLGFYNSGSCSGASQRHKHLQVVPLPLSPHTAPVPIEPLLDRPQSLPFRVGLRRFTTPESASHWEAQAVDCYRDLLEELDLTATGDGLVVTPYNLLMTRRWIALVPRHREHFGSISVNALGFAGSFFVKSEAALEHLRATGPLQALAAVGVPGSPP